MKLLGPLRQKVATAAKRTGLRVSLQGDLQRDIYALRDSKRPAARVAAMLDFYRGPGAANARRFEGLDLSLQEHLTGEQIGLLCGLAPHLVDVDLSNTPQAGAEVGAVLGALNLQRMQRLELSQTGVDDAGVELLTRHALPSLRILSLCYNPIGDRGAEALVRVAPTLKKLTKVNLMGIKASDANVAKLEESFDAFVRLSVHNKDYYS